MTDKRRQKRRRRGRKRRGSRILPVLLVLLFLICAGITGGTVYLYQYPLELKNEVVNQELKEPFQPEKNIRRVRFGEKDEVKITGQVNTESEGDYEITYSCRRDRQKVKVKVRDTKPPVLKTKPYTTDTAGDVSPEMFVQEVTDASEVTLQFKTPETEKTEGTKEIEIEAVDASGNRTTEKVSLTRQKDTEKPAVSGVADEEILQGKTLDFQNGITVSDNLDPAPVLEIDSAGVDFTVPGTYIVTYKATDRSGNVETIQKKVTVLRNAEYEQKVVYLTFDDGPSENTGKILDILKEYNAKATFFVTGNNQKWNSLLKRAHDEGHAVGLHTYTHDYKTVYSSEEAYFEDLGRISDLVKEVTGDESHIIRFPGGGSNTVSAKYSPGLMTTLTRKVQEMGYQYFDWNCDSTDASGNNVPVEKLVENATSCEAKHINILMHDTDAKDTTVEALPKIIEHYREQGYTFLPLTMDSYAPHHKVNN